MKAKPTENAIPLIATPKLKFISWQPMYIIVEIAIILYFKASYLISKAYLLANIPMKKYTENCAVSLRHKKVPNGRYSMPILHKNRITNVVIESFCDRKQMHQYGVRANSHKPHFKQRPLSWK